MFIFTLPAARGHSRLLYQYLQLLYHWNFIHLLFSHRQQLEDTGVTYTPEWLIVYKIRYIKGPERCERKQSVWITQPKVGDMTRENVKQTHTETINHSILDWFSYPQSIRWECNGNRRPAACVRTCFQVRGLLQRLASYSCHTVGQNTRAAPASRCLRFPALRSDFLWNCVIEKNEKDLEE